MKGIKNKNIYASAKNKTKMDEEVFYKMSKQRDSKVQKNRNRDERELFEYFVGLIFIVILLLIYFNK